MIRCWSCCSVMARSTARRRNSTSWAPTWTRRSGSPRWMAIRRALSSSIRPAPASSSCRRSRARTASSLPQQTRRRRSTRLCSRSTSSKPWIRLRRPTDKNDRLSVWEAFTYAGQAVKQSFDQKGTLVTERSIIDDGIERGAGADDVPGSCRRRRRGQRGRRRPRKAAHRDRSRDRAVEGRARVNASRAGRGRVRAPRVELAKISAQIRSASSFQSQRKDGTEVIFKKSLRLRVLRWDDESRPLGAATVSERRTRRPGPRQIPPRGPRTQPRRCHAGVRRERPTPLKSCITKPDPEKEDGGNFDELPEDEERNEREDARVGKQHEVARP